MFPERVAGITGSEKYKQKFDRASFMFQRIMGESSMGEIITVNVNDYSRVENRLLIGQLASVICPDLMEFSHCTHRAVSATLSLHFKEHLPHQELSAINAYLRRQQKIGGIWYGKDSTSLILFGVNNWFQTHVAPELTYDCKIMPGVPEKIDDPCPIRKLKIKKCHITHAEQSVITTAKDLLEEFNLPASDRTILTCTWVPCEDCFSLISDHREFFGEKIDVFSIYRAEGDDDDERMAKNIRNVLQRDNLGLLSGPFVSLPKNNGYGWWPARPDALLELNKHISRNNTQYVTESKLLLSALQILR